ncbi:MAG TPA: molybdopterin cofactor-binding domain-containing protein [Xanthobacteraceae bacterium]|nr:molybdopterin cofactor-binding domain-containing protein [Xanthobacteraceae bacterium]
MQGTDINRRRLLHGAGLVAGALVLGARWGAAAPQKRRSGREAHAVTAWVQIAPDSSVTLIASQSEMGQGTTTTLAAALADELYLSPERVAIAFAPFAPAYRDPVYNWMFTGNSQSTSSFYDVMRKMGAAAREMLIAAAATRLHVPADRLTMRDGIIHASGTRRTLRLGEIAAAAAQLPIPAAPALRADPPSAGRSVARWDIPGKVEGSAVFGIDVTVPDMLLAAVRSAPRFGGRLTQYDAAAIKTKPGVVALVEVPGGLAVVAKTYWQARSALYSAALGFSDDGATLDSGTGLPTLYADKLKTGPFFSHKAVGDLAKAREGAALKLDAVYQIPFQAHATMEPMNCTAEVRNDACEIWAPLQGVEMVQNVAAQVTGLPLEKITVHRTLIGGGFGRRLLADFVKQTLIIAKAVGRPVKLIWSREEDMQHDFYRPGMLHAISGALDQGGSVTALAHRVVSPSHMLYIIPRGFLPPMADWSDPAAPPEKIDTMAVEGLLDLPYDIPNQSIDQHRLELDVPVSVWRTTGHGPNNFVLESFIDELAMAAKADPLTFRRVLLAKNARARKLLNLAAEKAGWDSPPPAGRARGIALASAFGGLVANVAELSVTDNLVKVHRIVAAVDCGRTIDPDIAEGNILGGVVWGLSAMRTEMTFNKGAAQLANFDGFTPLHLSETPPCEVHFVDSGEKLGGTGELGPVPLHAAVCNAIFAATGKRIRALPLERSGFSFA